MTKANADKGKVLEKEVKEEFTELLKRPLFWFYRIPDARTCMGRIPKQPGDYFMFCDARSWLVELKEIKHNSRVPTSRFTQYNKMVRFQMTRNKSFVIIKHTETKLYRCVNVDDIDMNEKSLDLRDFREFTSAEEAVYYLLGWIE